MTSRAGTSLLALCARKLGLSDALAGALGHLRERRSAHRPGDVLCDLAVMLADGGKCVSDLAALGGQPALFGPMASVSTARRVMVSLGAAELDAIRRARALARERAWRAGAAPGEVILDFDSTPVNADSEKDGAAGHYKGGFGFHPLLVSCGREVLAGVLRPGNAGANNADDHLEVLELALEQLPPSALDGPILARSDSAGASHAFAAACRETRIRFSLGYPIGEPVRQAILATAEAAWTPAATADGEAREGAWVTELTGQVDLAAWPEGTRLICRRERPHPGAQLSFSDLDGHRFQCFITDQTNDDLAALEVRHRAHAVVEDRVRALKSMGLSNLPFADFDANAGRLELALLAHDITVWTQQLCLDGAHAVCEPKRPRYRILHVAGRLTRHASQLTPHLPTDWPWKAAITRAFQRLDALPASA
jgi:Transposase DDE domain group 1